MKYSFNINGMQCQSCASKLEAAIAKVVGVKGIKVTLDPPEATIESDTELTLQELNAAAASAGEYSLSRGRDSVRTEKQATAVSLYPLLLIVAYIAGISALVVAAAEDQSLTDYFRYFMAGFFLVFSFFKLLDLDGFVMAFKRYDLLARLPGYARLYPFIELVLGILYLLGIALQIAHISTLLIMSVGLIGVLKAVRSKSQIQCACLGTALNLPMTWVTAIENLTMALMAAVMLWY